MSKCAQVGNKGWEKQCSCFLWFPGKSLSPSWRRPMGVVHCYIAALAMFAVTSKQIFIFGSTSPLEPNISTESKTELSCNLKSFWEIFTLLLLVLVLKSFWLFCWLNCRLWMFPSDWIIQHTLSVGGRTQSSKTLQEIKKIISSATISATIKIVAATQSLLLPQPK